MNDMLSAPFVQQMIATTSNMYRLGWDEGSSGNISLRLDADEVLPYLPSRSVLRRIPMGFSAPELAGSFFLVTGSGTYFKNMALNAERDLGLLRIAEDGEHAELLWGYSEGGTFTSELSAHLMTHLVRLRQDKEQRVVMHCHPTHLQAMTFSHELNEAAFTRSLWQMCTECICVFPDGVGLLPWMICGTEEIGRATAEKMEQFRLVIWAMHGIFAAGKSLDDAFGLIEKVDKAAQIWMLTSHMPRKNIITDENLQDIAEYWKKNYRKDFLNL